MSVEAIERRARRHWAEGNPLLGSPAEIVASGDEILVSESGHLGLAVRTTKVDPVTDLEATWGAATTTRALPLFDQRLERGDFEFVLSALLSRRAALPESDACLSVSWPCLPRAEFPPSLGFRRLTNLAARSTAGIATAWRETQASVRVASAADTPVVAECWMQLVTEESKWGAVHPRASTPRLLLDEVRARENDPTATTLIAEADGRVVGFIAGHRAAHGSSIRARTSFRTVFYIDAVYVTTLSRRAGVGTALVTSCLGSTAARGVDGLALHYSELSPTSRPFWGGLGFSALWETWRMDL